MQKYEDIHIAQLVADVDGKVRQAHAAVKALRDRVGDASDADKTAASKDTDELVDLAVSIVGLLDDADFWTG